MSKPVIQRQDRVIHKNVRARNRIDIGNVISESGDAFTVMQGGSREYNIPESAVEGFDGSELYISILFSEVQRYKFAQTFLCLLILNLSSKVTLACIRTSKGNIITWYNVGKSFFYSNHYEDISLLIQKKFLLFSCGVTIYDS